jgi:hypothetical protein
MFKILLALYLERHTESSLSKHPTTQTKDPKSFRFLNMKKYTVIDLISQQ